MKFECEFIHEDDLRGFAIPQCQEKNHIQQVAFSTYHNALTQICFTCQKIRTSIIKDEIDQMIANQVHLKSELCPICECKNGHHKWCTSEEIFDKGVIKNG